MNPDPLERRQKLVEKERRQDKSHSQAGRVKRQQQNASRQGGADGGQAENPRQNRSHAGRPPKTEKYPRQGRSQQPARLFLSMNSFVVQQERKPIQPAQVDPQND